MNEKFIMFENRLQKVYKHFSKIATKLQISCFRVYDHDLPEFPFIIEIIEDVVHASEYKRRHNMTDEEHQTWLHECKQIIAKITQVTPDFIYIKTRQRKEGKEGQYQKVAITKQEKIITENGLKFIINLTDYLDIGLFLDHRITRNMVKEIAKDKRVLNLFCYTGSFSVYAAHGGAAQVTSIDMSNTYINWAKRNMQYNKLFDKDKHEFIQADVLSYINDILPNSYDIIICDPPTFSNSKRMSDSFDVQRDHVKLLNTLINICKEQGQIFFSNNFKGFKLDYEALKDTVSIKNITAQTTPFDFSGKLHRSCFLIQKN